jgi:murein DD-endopeptidase MepM/ murein hydrolase activator NlpD
MQMLPATFAGYAPGSPPDAIWDPAVEIDAAAAMLARNGAADGSEAGQRRALLAYNHDQAYVTTVMQREAEYQAWLDAGSPVTTGALPWPLRGPISQGFGCTGVGLEPSRGGCSHFHSGIDIAAPYGTAVVSSCPGLVTHAVDSGTGFGIHVVVSCTGSTLSTLYGHLSARVVREGDFVTAGQLLGYEGSTGNSSGPHLHFEVDDLVPQNAVDPVDYLAA